MRTSTAYDDYLEHDGKFLYACNYDICTWLKYNPGRIEFYKNIQGVTTEN